MAVKIGGAIPVEAGVVSSGSAAAASDERINQMVDSCLEKVSSIFELMKWNLTDARWIIERSSTVRNYVLVYEGRHQSLGDQSYQELRNTCIEMNGYAGMSYYEYKRQAVSNLFLSAIHSNNFELVNDLVSNYGANPNVQDKNGTPALLHASGDIRELLYNAGARIQPSRMPSVVRTQVLGICKKVTLGAVIACVVAIAYQAFSFYSSQSTK